MPNGRIGDHPITDIKIRNRRVFSKEIDDLVRAIVDAGGVRNWKPSSTGSVPRRGADCCSVSLRCASRWADHPTSPEGESG